MRMANFDTLKFAQRLEQAGLAPEQAAALAKAQKDALSEILDDRVATKADIKLLSWMLAFNLGLSLTLMPMTLAILLRLFG